MLVLSRRKNESVIMRINGVEITVTILPSKSPNTVRLGIEAPPVVTINRDEIQHLIDDEQLRNKA